MAAPVRDALDRVYPHAPLSPQAAAERFLDREPIDLGTWQEARREIEDSLDRHE